MSLFGQSRFPFNIFKPELGGRRQQKMVAERTLTEPVTDPANTDYPLFFLGSGSITAAVAQFPDVQLLAGAGDFSRTVVDAVWITAGAAQTVLIGVAGPNGSLAAAARQCITVNNPPPATSLSVVPEAIGETSDVALIAAAVKLIRVTVAANTPLFVPVGWRTFGTPTITGGRQALLVQGELANSLLLVSFYGRHYAE